MSSTAFDEYALEYDQWFDAHPFTYQWEIEALRRFIPQKGKGLEIGVGTGRFAIPFSIKIGLEPSEAMAAIARSRGITVYPAYGEELPFESEYFDFATIVTTICFVNDPQKVLLEARRVLKSGGNLVLAIIDKQSELGKKYEDLKASNKFYRNATFYSTAEILKLLGKAGFIETGICQTIFSNPDSITAPDPVREGYGEGAFVVISSIKQIEETK